MRNIMIFAAVMIFLGTFMADIADRMTPARASSVSQPAAMAAAPVATPASGRTLNVQRDARGHFGLRPTPGDYKSTVTTANGTVKGARTRIAMVDVGGIVVRDVDAMVLPDEALSENLLGLSFLSKLKRFEYANGAMVLEQ